MKKCFIILIFFNCFQCFGRVNDSLIVYQFDIANRFIWRGVAYNESPVFQGTFGYSGKYVNVFTYGAYSIAPDQYQELGLAVELKPFSFITVGAIDYFGLIDSAGVVHDATHFNSRSTPHILDAYIVYKNPGKFPLRILWSTFVYGNDRNINQKNRYSSYVELEYPIDLKLFTISPFAGGTPYGGFYSDKASLVNVGLKFSRTFNTKNRISFPTSMSFIFNPYDDKLFVHFLFGIK